MGASMVCVSGSGVGVDNARWRNQLPDAYQTISAGRIPHCPLHAVLESRTSYTAFSFQLGAVITCGRVEFIKKHIKNFDIHFALLFALTLS